MKYIRTKDSIVEHPHPNAQVFTFRYEILKIADTIEDLIQEGDLVRYIDTTTSYPYQGMFTEITNFNPVGLAVYRVVELYIKQPNGDYKLVAREKGNYKLELV